MKFQDLIRSGYSAWVNNSIVRVMKIMVLLMTTFLLQVSAAGFAQKVSFSKKDASLKELFTEIRKQTGFNVFWQEGKVNDALKFDASFNNVSLEEVLNKTLSPQNLGYKIINQTVVVTKKDKPFVDKITDFFSAISIEGKITDAETGKPIPNVTITLKGSTRSVVADDKGYFKFNGLPDNASLEFSSIGYKTILVSASGETMMIRLTPVAQTLQDVIVSTGYQTLKKSSTTGSFAVIDAKEIESSPSVNLLDRLMGKVTGVDINTRTNKIQMRGVNSYNGNYQPLVIIDGFPAINQNLTTITSGSINGNPNNQLQPSNSGNAILSTFNPEDIENITFLKDAAASAIWGARAANGVIVINTKHGRKGAQSINFSTSLSMSAPANFDKLTSMNSSQYIDLEQELVDKGFISDPVAALIASPANGYKSAPVSEAEQWMFKAIRNPIYAAQRDSALNVLRNRSNTSQIKDYLLQKAVSQQYNLSLSGGSENSSYYVAGNYTKDQPIYKSNSGESYNVISNLTNDFLNKRLKLSTGVNYNYSSAKVNSAALQALGVNSYGLAPYEMLVDDSGNKIYKGITFTKSVSDSLTKARNLLPWTYNAIDELNYNNTITTKNAIRINAALTGTITNWLNLTVSGQIQKNITDQVNNQNLNSYVTRDLINNSNNTANLTNTAYLRLNGVPKGGVYNTSRSTNDDYSLRAQADVNKTFAEVHRINFIAGTEIRQSKYVGNEQTLYGYDENYSTSVSVPTTIYYTTLVGGSNRFNAPGTVFRGRTRYLSYYGNGTYSFQDKYFATASVRFDDINIIGVDRRDRARPLWSTGLRWDLKKESFLDKMDWVNALSLRATLGTSGNPPLTSNNYTTLATTGTDSYTQLPYTYISTPANQNIGWETTKMTNFGVDATLFNNRLNFTLDVYNKKTTDILASLPVNSTYGFNSIQYNAGNLSGHGVDLGLSGTVLKGRDWSWNSTLNFSYNTNKVTDARYQPSTTTVGTPVITSGYPLDNLFVYRWAGLDNKGQSQIYTADGTILSSTSTVTLKPEDRVYAGRTTAPYFGGFINTVNYKSFTLLVRATYNLGNKFLIQNINSSNYPNSASSQGLLATSQALVNRWRNPGDEAFTDVPGLTGVNFNSINRYIYSDLNVRDAGNIRLQQVSLNYSVPQYLLRATPFIKRLNVGATVSNLGLLWAANKEGIDPDYQMTGTYTNLPPTRNYVLTLNLSL